MRRAACAMIFVTTALLYSCSGDAPRREVRPDISELRERLQRIKDRAFLIEDRAGGMEHMRGVRLSDIHSEINNDVALIVEEVGRAEADLDAIESCAR